MSLESGAKRIGRGVWGEESGKWRPESENIKYALKEHNQQHRASPYEIGKAIKPKP
jgi:hypothetical protein